MVIQVKFVVILLNGKHSLKIMLNRIYLFYMCWHIACLPSKQLAKISFQATQYQRKSLGKYPSTTATSLDNFVVSLVNLAGGISKFNSVRLLPDIIGQIAITSF